MSGGRSELKDITHFNFCQSWQGCEYFQKVSVSFICSQIDFRFSSSILIRQQLKFKLYFRYWQTYFGAYAIEMENIFLKQNAKYQTYRLWQCNNVAIVTPKNGLHV